MKWRIVWLLLSGFYLILPVHAQSSTALLTQVNDLRASVGMPPYTVNSALTSAAQSQAQWMADTGKVSHTRDDGSGPRSRAQAAGYSSNFVSENIYMGSDAGIGTAWNFWVNSPIHYAGLTSPNYNNIGIGAASGANGTAFVLVFGNSSGSLPQANRSSGNNSGNNGDQSAPSAPPSYVVGVDAIGNIMHEVQPGHTLGDIALIYGYTWGDIPYMLEINGMTEDDIRFLEVGSVVLVPPQDGTYTPTPALPTATPTHTPTPTIPPQTATSDALIAQMVAPATFVLPSATPTVEPVETPTPIPTLIALEKQPPANSDNSITILLIAAVALQVGIIAFATFEFFRRSK